MPSVYRARLGKGMDKITLGYVSSMHSDMQILEYDILGSYTLMLLKCKIIQKSDAKKILSALNSIKEKDLMRGGESEDVHEIVESIVIRKALKSGNWYSPIFPRRFQVCHLASAIPDRYGNEQYAFCLRSSIQPCV